MKKSVKKSIKKTVKTGLIKKTKPAKSVKLKKPGKLTKFEKFDKVEKEIKEAEDAVLDLGDDFDEESEAKSLITRAARDLERAEAEVEEADEDSF